MNSKYLVFISIGFELIGAILLAIYLGQYLERQFQLSSVVTVGLIFLFLTGWLLHIIFLLKKIQNKDEKIP